MKKLKLLPLIFIAIVAIFVAIMAYVRFDNDNQLRQYFYSQWRRNYVVKMNNNQSYINTTPGTKKNTALSEGQGYGMYIAALAAKRGWNNQAEFDQLNNFYLNHREKIKGKQTMLMSWKVIEKGGKWKTIKNSATDGDLYIAQALLMASKQWKNKKYKQEAVGLLKNILRYEYNSETGCLTVGNWADSHSKYYSLVRTSDVMPTFFANFYDATNDEHWLRIRTTMLKCLNDLSMQHKTGLVPDFAWVSEKKVQPVKAKTVATKYDGDYSANACRVLMLLAQSKEPLAEKTLRRMMKFFSKQNTITAGLHFKRKGA